MVARFLITTALEETWPADDVPVLFLGEWCRLYQRKSAWEKRDAIVANYHWDDRKKVRCDYRYLTCVYENLLRSLSEKLNDIHSAKLSERYWRIVLGPWLGTFIAIVYDRWEMLQRAIHGYQISGVRSLDRPDGTLVPNDMAEFNRLSIDDNWNEMIYSRAMSHLGMSIEVVRPVLCQPNQVRRRRPWISDGIRHCLERISTALAGDDDYVLMSSNFGAAEDAKLQIKLGQVPRFWPRVECPKPQFDSSMREWHLVPSKQKDSFMSFLYSEIPINIPRTYLEGHSVLMSRLERTRWPKTPKAILTGTSWAEDDAFKVWAASKVEAGTPLVIAQHGGNYGVSEWNFMEEHQLKISDRFISWGWRDTRASGNIAPIGRIRPHIISAKKPRGKRALLVQLSIPRQSYHMFSTPVAAEQWGSYFEDQCDFVRALPRDIQESLIVRLSAQDYGLGQVARWADNFPTVRLDPGVKPIRELIRCSKICISTYNATSFLETLQANMPTIVFWNPNHWELRSSALLDFDALRSVGVLHYSAEAAAHALTVVWDNIEEWWRGHELQNVRREFCEKYSRTPVGSANLVANVLRDVAAVCPS